MKAFRSRGSIALWFGLPLLVACSGFVQIHDPDVWWRVRTGELIWESKSIPSQDPFSHASPGPWRNVEPLGNLLLFGFYRLGGPEGLQIGSMMLLVGLGLALVWLGREALNRTPPLDSQRLGVVALCVGLTAANCHFRFGPKPDQLSFAFFALFLVLLHRARGSAPMEPTRRRTLLFVIPLTWLWMLVHRGANLSIPLCGLCAGWWMLQPPQRPLARTAAMAALGSLGALVLTPGGLGNVTSAFQVLGTQTFAESLPEWQPLSWQRLVDDFPILLGTLVLWLTLVASTRRFDFRFLIAVVTGVLAARHMRFVPFFAIALLPELVFRLDLVVEKLRSRAATHVRPALFGLLLSLLGITPLAHRYLSHPAETLGFGVHHFILPDGAAEFLRQNPPPGSMYHSFNFGSYLLYALSPHIKKVFIDGRNDLVYPPAFYDATERARTDPKILRRQLEEYDIAFAVLENTKLADPRYLTLHRDPDWPLVYLDDNAAILVERTPASQKYLQTHAYRELHAHDALYRAMHPEPTPEYRRFAEEVLRLRRQSPFSVRANLLETFIHKNAGNRAAYRAARRRTQELAAARGAKVRVP